MVFYLLAIVVILGSWGLAFLASYLATQHFKVRDYNGGGIFMLFTIIFAVVASLITYKVFYNA